MNIRQYTYVTLCNWLKSLGLPSTGTKDELLKRLYDLPLDVRGISPPKSSSCTEETVPNEENADDADNMEPELSRYELKLSARETAILLKEFLLKENEMLKHMHTIQTSSNYNKHFTKMLPEHDGGRELLVWLEKLQCLRENYKISEEDLKIIIVGKLKGKAQEWLYSKPAYKKKKTFRFK